MKEKAYGHSVCALAARAGFEPATAGDEWIPRSATELPRRVMKQGGASALLKTLHSKYDFAGFDLFC